MATILGLVIRDVFELVHNVVHKESYIIKVTLIWAVRQIREIPSRVVLVPHFAGYGQ